MEFEDLKSLWQHQTTPAFAGRSKLEIEAAIRARLTRLNRTVLARDFREIAAAALCLIIFGCWFWETSRIVSRIGAAVVVLGNLLILFRIVRARFNGPKPHPYLEMQAFFTYERGRIHAQIRLLESVLWWYLGPSLIGTNLYVFGLTGLSAISFAFLALSAGLSFLLYRLNQRAVKSRLVPVQDALDALLAETQDRR